MKHLLNPVIEFFYPTSCLHCKSFLDRPLLKLCNACKELIELSQDKEDVCFEKISPAFDLYSDYLVFQSKKIRSFFLGAVSYKYLQEISQDEDFIALYYPLDERIFTKSYKPLEAIVKGVAEMLQIPFLKPFKQTITKEVFDERGLCEKLILTKTSKKLMGKKLLLISENKMKVEKIKDVKHLLSLTQLKNVALFG